ncbi:DMT family transporter [Bosea caraganae]|uniref:DMT family transporter n=1 Tax=Bosea caraganae TaxID=2763117 RepID=UPI0015F0C70B|nr:DMT family transporter [Bosea caraganae]
MTLVSSFLITINDALTKLLVAKLPAGQIVSIQAFAAIVVVLALAMRRGSPRLAVANRGRQLLRAGLNALSLITFVVGLMHLPLSIATTLSFANPLFVSVLAPVLLGERLDGFRMLAVVAGFAGVMLVLDPGSGGMTLYALLPLAAAAFSALRDILTRRLAQTDSSITTMLHSSVVTMIVGLVWSQGRFVMPTLQEAMLLAMMTAAHMTALYCMIEALRFADAATVSPFKYASLLWAIGLDLLIWLRPPEWNVMIGAAIIIAAMSYIYRRERRFLRGTIAPAPAGSLQPQPRSKSKAG